VSSIESNLLYHVTHLTVSNKCYLHTYDIKTGAKLQKIMHYEL
jgi:hypothetical protein